MQRVDLDGRVLLARGDGPEVADAGRRAQRASLRVESGDGFVRFLGSILVPADEIALFLLEAASIEAATEFARQAAIPSERILEVVRLGAFLPSRRGNPNSSSKEPR